MRNGLLVALLVVIALVLGIAMPSIIESSKTVLAQIRERGSHQVPVQQASAISQGPAPAHENAATPAPAAKINEQAQVIILGYQRIVPTVRRPETEITPAGLEAQMQQVKDLGIAVIPLQDLLAWKRGEKEIPPVSAVITFDDGWKSQYETAWPLLKKFGYPFTLFVYTDYIRGGPKAGGESLDWDQLAEMRDAGVDIEGQTASHRDLRGKGVAAMNPAYETWLWNQLAGSRQILEEHLGIKVNALALPYGLSNQHVKDIAKKAGYEALLTVNGEKIMHSTPATALGRFMIQASKPQIFTAAVQAVHSGGGLRGETGQPLTAIAELAPKPPAQPPDGAVVSDLKPDIKVNVEEFAPLDPATLSMRIGGLGQVDAKYDPASKTFSYKPTRNLATGPCTVIVSGSGNARRNKFETRWTFTVQRSASNNPAASGANSQAAH